MADSHVPGAYVVRGGGVDHSFIDLDDPTRVEFPYMERITELFDAWAPAGQRLRAVHVGGAGMTLARYLAYTRPTSAQIVLEPDAELTAEVRRELPLPSRSGIKVRPVDGRTGIRAMRDEYADIIVVDAFDRLSVPGELVTAQALADMARVLRTDGVVAINVTDRSPFAWTHRVLAGLAHVLPQMAVNSEIATLRGRRAGNLVLIASRRELPALALLRTMDKVAFPSRWLFGAELDSWRGAAEPFDDAAPQGSPVPPSTKTHFG
ncbi:spermidine synthase [Propionibacterium sp.]|uniref:spermidine synthase n=1 Tax=Propionibacterium sp. TaxID=1977903 RepID=UPI0039E7D81D